MKKLTLLLGLLLLFPLVSSAATLTATQRASIEAELQVLETELIAILSAQAPVTQPSGTIGTAAVGTEPLGGTTLPNTSGTVQITMGADELWLSAEGVSSNIGFTVSNNTNSTIYIPTSISYVPVNGEASQTPGMTFTITGTSEHPDYKGSASASMTCGSLTQIPVASGYITACVVSPGQSQQVTIAPNILPAFTDQGTYSLSLMNMSYATTSINPIFNILTLPNNQTSPISI